MQRIRRDDDVGKLLCHTLVSRRRLGGFWRRRGWGRFAAQNLEHHGSAGRAFPFNGFAPVLHGFFHPIDDLLLGLAFDAVSFRHRKNWLSWSFMPRGSYGA